MLEITSLGQLLTLVKSRARVTVIDFYADWCGPCQRIKPDYERLSRLYDAQKVVFCKCNVDSRRDCASHFNIQAMPTFVVCHGGETITTVRGADLGTVQRNIDLAVNLISSGPAPSSDGPAAATNDAASAASRAATSSPFAEEMLRVVAAKKANDATAVKEACDRAFSVMKEQSKTQPFGVLLLLYLASEAFSIVAVEEFFTSLAARPSPECDYKDLIVNQVLRHVVELMMLLTWDNIAAVQLIHRAVLALLRCPQAQAAVVQSPFFYNDFITSGSLLERRTLLGALLGVGPFPRVHAVATQQRSMMEWQVLLKMFSPEAPEKHPEAVYQVQRTVEHLAGMNTSVVSSLLQAKTTREATLRYLGQALALNEDYQKTMHHDSPLASRYFMTQLQAVLISATLPMFKRGFTPSEVPSYYLLPDAHNHRLVNFGGDDVERVVHYDSEHPLPPFPATAEPYKPTVHLFFMAARAITLCATVFIEERERDERNATHPQSPPRQQAAFRAEKCLYDGLLGSAELGLARLEYLNKLSAWLLHVMEVRPDGTLPATPPAAWCYMPQALVDSAIRATQLTPDDANFIEGTVALMLVLMGNITYFPKPHTHALFPLYLTRLMRNYTLKKALLDHVWFTKHIISGCIHCYIAVEKSTYEKVQARYELAHCIKIFLASEALCVPFRAELAKDVTVLERFSHMAVADVNEAVDQLIETLAKMRNLAKSGADLSENPSPASSAARAGQADGEGNARRSSSNNNEEDDEEEGDNTDSAVSYHQMGLSLHTHILLFNASIDMFNQLSVQFPRGVSQNMVAQQISQMLARSLVAFAGPNSKDLKIEFAERYDFRPREILGRLVDCLTSFRRMKNFLWCMCNCGVPLADIRGAMSSVIVRHLVSEDLEWKLSEMSAALEHISTQVNEEETFWDEAPDYALDALLSTPLTDPVALPAELKDVADLVYVNRDTIHHLLLSENKHPFTKAYLDEAMVEEFNKRPEVAAARAKVQEDITNWLREARAQKK